MHHSYGTKFIYLNSLWYNVVNYNIGLIADSYTDAVTLWDTLCLQLVLLTILEHGSSKTSDPSILVLTFQNPYQLYFIECDANLFNFDVPWWGVNVMSCYWYYKKCRLIKCWTLLVEIVHDKFHTKISNRLSITLKLYCHSFIYFLKVKSRVIKDTNTIKYWVIEIKINKRGIKRGY